MNTTRLYIEEQEVELDKSVQFAITKQFEDISNPTSIINTWSKTVSIPFTQSNNKLFGHIYNPDRVSVESAGIGGLNRGIYFNPLKKLNFKLVWNDALVMQGYAKMNEIKQVKGKGTYEITLFGELGKLFSEMKKITFDESTTDTDYLINGSRYVDDYITKEFVSESWNGEDSFVCFAPNNSYSEEFDYNTFQIDTNSSKTFKDVLTEKAGWEENVKVSPDTIIKDGLLPRQIAEFRSYNQLPYIKFSNLFRVFQDKAEELTGYNFILDTNWFNINNNYWNDLVYMLKPFNVKNGKSYNNSYTSFTAYNSAHQTLIGNRWAFWENNQNLNLSQTVTLRTETAVEKIPVIDNTTTYLSKYVFQDDSLTRFHLNIPITLSPNFNATSMRTDNAFLIDVSMVGSNGTISTSKTLFRKEGSTLTADGYTIQDISGEIINGGSYRYISFVLDCKLAGYKHEFGDSVYFSVSARWLYNSEPFDGSGVSAGIWYRTDSNASLQVDIVTGVFRSGSHFNLNSLWNNEYNLFEEILRYCKTFRIGIFSDEINKTITFKSFKDYFRNYVIYDWTDRIDKSKDFTVKPITFEDKYILYNYKDTNTQLGKQYKEKFGYNYGEKRLQTQYNFNDNTKNLFTNSVTSINNTDMTLTWDTIFNDEKIVYTLPAEIFVYNRDKDNKQVDCFGSYFFYCGLSNFDNMGRYPILSDDTPFQQAYDTYYYSQDMNKLQVYTYPLLKIVKDGDICLFNTPSENYTYLNLEYDNTKGIYENCWIKYISERYDSKNKIVTCYLKIKPTDYINFEFNKFIKIENQLYIINKIYDYDISSNLSTKVDLVTIQNPLGYTTNN